MTTPMLLIVSPESAGLESALAARADEDLEQFRLEAHGGVGVGVDEAGG